MVKRGARHGDQLEQRQFRARRRHPAHAGPRSGCRDGDGVQRPSNSFGAGWVIRWAVMFIARRGRGHSTTMHRQSKRSGGFPQVSFSRSRPARSDTINQPRADHHALKKTERRQVGLPLAWVNRVTQANGEAHPPWLVHSQCVEAAPSRVPGSMERIGSGSGHRTSRDQGQLHAASNTATGPSWR